MLPEPPCNECTEPLPCKAEDLEQCAEKRGEIPQQVILAEESNDMQVHNLAMAQRTVMLQGMIISPHVPSESKFEQPTPELSDATFNNLKDELEDLMPPIDQNWKRFRCLGTSWKAAGARVGKGRVRTLYVRMFPGSIYHVPSAIRSKVYTEIIPSTSFRIDKGTQGSQHMAIYILPYANLPSFIEQIEQLNNTAVAELNKKIDEFQASRDYQAIVDVLAKYGVADIVKDINFHISKVSWSWTALSLDTETVAAHVEEAWKKAFGEVKAKEKQMLDDFIQNDLQQKRETAEQCLEQLRTRLSNIAKRIALARRNPERLKQDLEALRGMALSMGAEALTESVVTPLLTIIDHPEKAIELFGTKEVSNEVELRVKAFIKSF